MYINRLKVSGSLGFDFEFSSHNIILGENDTGKSTFCKLLLYSLGADFNSFIPEISTDGKCNSTNVYITFNNKKLFLITRKLPQENSVTIAEIQANEIIKESLQVLNLEEYSEFILNNDNLPVTKLDYGDSKTASMRFYFYLRAAYVDQDTQAYKILSDIGGERLDYLNSQTELRKAIIQVILGAYFPELHELKAKISVLQKEESEINGSLASIIYQLKKNDSDIRVSTSLVDKIKKKVKEIQSEKKDFAKSLKEAISVQTAYPQEVSKSLKNKDIELIGLLKKYRSLELQLLDLESTSKRIKSEIETLNETYLAKDLILSIPVDNCPVCLSNMAPIRKPSAGNCPYCNNEIPEDNFEKGLLFKRMLEEALIESKELISKIKKEIKSLEAKIEKQEADLENERKKFLKTTSDTESTKLYKATQNKLESLISKEIELINILSLLEEYFKHKEGLNSKTKERKEVREEIESIEEKIHKKLSSNKKKWENIAKLYITEIFPEYQDFHFDDMFSPVLLENSIRQISSASLKVAIRIVYILSLLHLSENAKINHPKFIVLDSPRDKDLDKVKYKVILDILENQKNQYFITGSIYDQELYNNENVLIKLTEKEKLLQPM